MNPRVARCCLYLYLAAVVMVSVVHDIALLGGILALALLGAGSARWHLLRRSVRAILAFNLTVSLGYLVVAGWQERIVVSYLLLINLRVLLLVFLGFWFVARVNLLQALTGWPLAALVATLAIGQIKTFERVLRDFRFAFESRNLIRPRLVDRGRHAAAQAQTLLDKAVTAAGDSALAMRSRGAFDE